MRRAEIAQSRMRIGLQILFERGRDTRFADPRLADEEHHASFARFDLLPAPEQQLELLGSADERREASPMLGLKRLTEALAPITCHAGTFSAKPFRETIPRLRYSNRPPVRLRVLDARSNADIVVALCPNSTPERNRPGLNGGERGGSMPLSKRCFEGSSGLIHA